MEWSRRSVVGAVAAFCAVAASAQSVDGWVAPIEARAMTNALSTANPEHIRRGRSLFVKHCVTCHGDLGRGDGPSARLHAKRSGYAPRDLSRPDVQAGLTDGEMFWKIGAGWRPGGRIVMPGVRSEVSEEDRWRIVLYVRSLLDKGGSR